MAARKRRNPPARKVVHGWRTAAEFFGTEGDTEGARLRRAIVNEAIEFEDELDSVGPGSVALLRALKIGYWQGQLSRLPDARKRLFLAGPGFTPHQRRLLHFLLDGLTDEQIAGRMAISPQRVKQHVAKIAERFPGRGRLRQRIFEAAFGQGKKNRRVG